MYKLSSNQGKAKPNLHKKMKLLVALIILTFSSMIGIAAEGSIWKQSPMELLKDIEGKHPVTYYALASHHYKDGKKDEAVFWYYVGQIRYRFHLSAKEDILKPSGDPAIFSSLSHTLGTPINEYGFGDLDAMLKTIDRAIKWDKEHENKYTSIEIHKKKHKEVLEGLQMLRKMIIDDADKIRKQREENNLPNRNS